jgi:ABC-type branched-subunit amino acid transport system ATPase component
VAHLLEIRSLKRSFGGVVAVKGLDLDVRDGELVSLIGPMARARPRPST